jgi:hypothetical protein
MAKDPGIPCNVKNHLCPIPMGYTPLLPFLWICQARIIKLNTTKKPLAIALSGAVRGFRGRDDGGNVTKVPLELTLRIPLYNELILIITMAYYWLQQANTVHVLVSLIHYLMVNRHFK